MLYTTVYYFIKAITKMLDMLNGTKNNVFVFIIKWQGRIWLSCYAFSLPVVVLSLPSVVFRLWEVVVVLPTERVLCDFPSMLSVVDYRIVKHVKSIRTVDGNKRFNSPLHTAIPFKGKFLTFKKKSIKNDICQ